MPKCDEKLVPVLWTALRTSILRHVGCSWVENAINLMLRKGAKIVALKKVVLIIFGLSWHCLEGWAYNFLFLVLFYICVTLPFHERHQFWARYWLKLLCHHLVIRHLWNQKNITASHRDLMKIFLIILRNHFANSVPVFSLRPQQGQASSLSSLHKMG